MYTGFFAWASIILFRTGLSSSIAARGAHTLQSVVFRTSLAVASVVRPVADAGVCPPASCSGCSYISDGGEHQISFPSHRARSVQLGGSLCRLSAKIARLGRLAMEWPGVWAARQGPPLGSPPRPRARKHTSATPQALVELAWLFEIGLRLFSTLLRGSPSSLICLARRPSRHQCPLGGAARRPLHRRGLSVTSRR